MAPSSAVPQPESRYARVKAILANAAGDSPSDYGGLGAFWELPLSELIEAKVYGVRLITPAIQMSCCDDGDSRSAGSGLVRALRGTAPFDGGRFPPFMWGGNRVVKADVDIIADWIDDGCPADDHGRTLLDITMREVTRAKVVDAEFDVASPGRQRYPYRQGRIRRRAYRGVHDGCRPCAAAPAVANRPLRRPALPDEPHTRGCEYRLSSRPANDSAGKFAICRGHPALPLLSVGDAGSRYDPVSGQGIVKALRGGIFGSYAIADWLHHRDQRGLARYRLMLKGEFAAYRDTLRGFYAREQRWPDKPFWRRRHSELSPV